MSNINYAIIDETFPVAGQDNDTETFRRNFDSIKTNFRYAQEEIEDLQNNAARTNTDNDFYKNRIKNAIFENTRFAVVTEQTIATNVTEVPIDFEAAHYQIFNLGISTNFTFGSFPGDPQVDSAPYNSGGKVTLELVSRAATPITVTFLTTGSGASRIYLNSFPQYPLEMPVSSNRVILEIWRHNKDDIFVKYVGAFALAA